MRRVAKGTKQTCRHPVKVKSTPQPGQCVRPGVLSHTTSRTKDRSSANTCGGQDASSREAHSLSPSWQLHSRPSLGWQQLLELIQNQNLHWAFQGCPCCWAGGSAQFLAEVPLQLLSGALQV